MTTNEEIEIEEIDGENLDLPSIALGILEALNAIHKELKRSNEISERIVGKLGTISGVLDSGN